MDTSQIVFYKKPAAYKNINSSVTLPKKKKETNVTCIIL